MLRLFSGLKNQGDFQSKRTTWGKFNPEDSRINFAVPSEESLIKSVIDIPGSLHPGITEEAIQLQDKDKEYILMFDGKKIAPALGPNDIVDINLWDLEKPSITERKEKKINDLSFIETIEKLMTCDLQNTDKFQLPTVLSLMSSYLRDIHDTELGHRRLLKRLFIAGE